MDNETDHMPPFSLRLSRDERSILENDAGVMPVGAYIRARLFDAPSPRKSQTRPKYKDKLLSQILAELGASRLSSNLNQLAKASNNGKLPVNSETEQAINQAAADIEDMKVMLSKALRLDEEGS